MLRDEIKTALKDAMKDKDQMTVSTLRLIQAALKDRDISVRAQGNTDGISNDDILAMLQSMIKQRRESISMYEKGGRLELAENEASEIKIIERFLPTQLSEEEIATVIDALVDELDCKDLKDMGRAMAALREKHAGCMDFGKASAALKAKLA